MVPREEIGGANGAKGCAIEVQAPEWITLAPPLLLWKITVALDRQQPCGILNALYRKLS